MLKKYDTIVGISNVLNKDGSVAEDVKLRTDRAIYLWDCGYSDILSFSGGYDKDSECLEDESPWTQAEGMKRYAIEKGVPEKQILKEELSRDTVGQAYFVKRDLVLPRNWEKLVVVSSDYHMRRVMKIFDLFFPRKNFLVDYKWANTGLVDDLDIEESERQRFDMFISMFGGVKPGDNDAIEEIMFTCHKTYSKNPDEYTIST